MNWRRAQTDVKAKRSLADDAEFRGRDAAARWLERNEKRVKPQKRTRRAG